MDPFEELEAYGHGHCAFFPDALSLHVADAQRDAPFHAQEGEDPRGIAVEPNIASHALGFPLRGRLAHETDHLLRALGTSWGLMSHVLQGRMLGYYLKILTETPLSVDLAGGSLAAAFREIRRLSPDSCKLSDGGRLAKLLYVFARETDLRRALLGFLPHGAATLLSEPLAKLWGLKSVDFDTIALFPEPFPFDDTYRGQLVSARSILESLGIIKEATYAAWKSEKENVAVFHEASRDYTFALSYAEHIVRWRARMEVQPLEIEAALNLALWPPLGPSGPVSGRAWRWEDIEPGHRFCRILQFLVDARVPFTEPDSLSPAQRDEHFREFFDRTSRALDWPSPFELATAWRRHLEETTPWSISKYHWVCLGDARLRTRYALSFLEQFQRSPFQVWHGPRAVEGLGAFTFSYVLYTDVLELPSHHYDSGERTLSGRLESYVFLGMKHVMNDTARSDVDRELIRSHLHHILHLIDPTLRERALSNCAYLKATIFA